MKGEPEPSAHWRAPRIVWFLLVTASALTEFSPVVRAQGGPPFRSDDPDTPGNRNWEINAGFVGDRNPSGGSYETPNLDLNYGVRHRIQLKFELPLSIQEVRGDSGHVVGGLGNSLVGVKWRFYAHHSKEEKRNPPGERESNFGLSVYPQLMLNNPTRSVSRGVVEAGPQFLLPLEANAKIGPMRISGEIGYWFANNHDPNSWLRGIVIGHEFKNKAEVGVELYDQYEVRTTAAGPRTRESTVGVGGRAPIAGHESARFIGMAGRAFVFITPTNGQPSWVAYAGIQVLVGSKRHSSDYMGE